MLRLGGDVNAKVKSVGSGVTSLRFTSRLCYLLAVRPWAGGPTSLNLRFLLPSVEITIAPTSQPVVKITRDKAREALSTVPDTWEALNRQQLFCQHTPFLSIAALRDSYLNLASRVKGYPCLLRYFKTLLSQKWTQPLILATEPSPPGPSALEQEAFQSLEKLLRGDTAALSGRLCPFLPGSWALQATPSGKPWVATLNIRLGCENRKTRLNLLKLPLFPESQSVLRGPRPDQEDPGKASS